MMKHIFENTHAYYIISAYGISLLLLGVSGLWCSIHSYIIKRRLKHYYECQR